MKLKLLKITAMIALPVAALITLPMVLTSCSTTTKTEVIPITSASDEETKE